jgi:uncharacterized RDD family membrane protein YckC
MNEEEHSYENRLKRYSLDELYEVEQQIDKFNYPDRYEMVIAEIARRKDKLDLKDPVIENPLIETPPDIPAKVSSPYAGFWKRFPSMLIDSLVVLPVGILVIWLNSQSKILAMIILLPHSMMIHAYHVYFHARWGATIGKMALSIRVVKKSGESIAWREAILRSFVDIFLSIMMVAATFIALIKIPEAEYSSSNWMNRYHLQLAFSPTWIRWVIFASYIWFWSEVVVLLFNKKKRAFHDFIAGTIVLKNDRIEEIKRISG